MMRYLMAAVMLFAISSLGCNDDAVLSDQDQTSGWNSVRSDWTDTASYDENSSEAQNALSEYQNGLGANSAYTIAHFQIVLESVNGNNDGTQTWTYAITKTQDGRDFKDLSHFTMLMPNCNGGNIVNFGGGSYGQDPSNTCANGADGLKWDIGVSANETVYYSFTTDKVYALGEVTGLMKYGTSCTTGTIPGPDCSTLGTIPGDPTDPGNDDPVEEDPGTEDPGDNCPSWIDTLTLTSSVTYKNFHGYNHLGFPVYYVGETMHANLKICNPTVDNADGLKVKTIVTYYPGGGLACGSPVQEWIGVNIASNDCLTFDHSYYLANNCPWSNYESHLVVTREADNNCPVAALIVETGAIGFFDP